MSAPEDDDITPGKAVAAAEYALGLLDGEELLAAKGQFASDDGFAWRKIWWDSWFAPLTDEIAGAEPSPVVWERIAAEVHSDAGGANNVIDLTQRLRRWQWTAGITSAAAAVLAAVMFAAPDAGSSPVPGATDAPQIASASPLVAQVPIGDTGLRLDVTYIPDNGDLLVGAIGLTPDGVHDHELWLVPADGSALQSLGVVRPGEVLNTHLSEEITRNMGNGVQLVLTREPIGGKPEGVDAGPVVAQGSFSEV